eukprot:jgi/Chlat1/2663/Chrsp179S02512
MADGEEEEEEDDAEQRCVVSNRVHPVLAPSDGRKLRERFRDGVPESWSEPQTQWEGGGSAAPLLLVEPPQHQPRAELVGASQAYALSCCGFLSPESLSIAVSLASAAKAEKLLETAPPGSCLLRVEEDARSLWLSLKLRYLVRHHQLLPATLQPSIESTSAPNTSRRSQVEQLATRLVLPTSSVRRVRRWPMRAGFFNRLSQFCSELARCPHFVEYAVEALSLADELAERPFLVCLWGEDLCLCKMSSAGSPHTMRLFIDWQAEKLMVGTGNSVRSLSEALVRLMGTTESKLYALETGAEPFWQTPQVPQAQMRETAVLMLLRSLHPTMQRQGLKQMVELLTQDNKTSASWPGQACSALLKLVLAGGSIGVEAVQAIQLLLKDSPATVLENTQALLKTAAISKTVSVSLYQLLLDAVEQSEDTKLSLDMDVLLEHYKAIKLDTNHAHSGIAGCDERREVPLGRKNLETVQRLQDSQQVTDLPGSARQTDGRPRVHSIAQGDAGSNSYAATVALLKRSAPYQAKILLLKLLNNVNCPSQASRAAHTLMQDCASCLLHELPEQDQLCIYLYEVIHHLGLERHMADCTESLTAIGHGPEALLMLAGYARSQPVGDRLSLCKAVMQTGSSFTGDFSDVHAHSTSRQLLAATSWLQALAACLLHSNDHTTDTAFLEKLSSSGAIEMAVSCTQQLCASVDAIAFRPTQQLHLLFWWQQLAQLLSRLAHSLTTNDMDVYWQKFSAILGSDAHKYFTSGSATAESQHQFVKLLELICLQPRCPFKNAVAFMGQTAALLVSQFKTLYIEGSSESLASCSRLCQVLASVVTASDICAEALYSRDLLPFLTTEISSEYDMFKKSVSRSASISSVDHSPSKDRVSAKSSGGSAVGQVAAAHPNRVPSLRLSALGDQRASSAVSSGRPPSKPSRLSEHESTAYQPGSDAQNGFFDLNEQVDAEEAEELSSEYIIGKPASAQSRTGPLVDQTRSADRITTGAARSDRSAPSSSRLHVPKLALGRCSFAASTKSGLSSPANQSVALALTLEAEGLTSQYRLHLHVYSIASLHVSLLYLMLTMLLTPRGSLDRRHSDSFPMQRGKPSTLLHLHHHMNHPANAAVAQQLVVMVADSANAGLKRLLKLLVCSQLDPSIYNNKQHIARGAYAQVFKVELADSVVALKVVDLPSSAHDRCTVHDVYREIHILEELREEQCVSRLIDYGVDRDSCYVVMAYYPASLRTWRVAQSEPFEEYVVLYLRVYQQVLNAAAKLEEHSIIHYDLKCDNILLSPHDTVLMEDFWHPARAVLPFNVCISDFGESKLSAPSDAFTIRDRGTDFIKSPEMLTVHSVQSKLLHEDQSAQVTGADKACDAWSLTCLLFELITGKYLFQEDDWVRFYVRVTDPAQELIVPDRRAMLAEHPHILGFLDWGLIRNPKLRPSVPELKERFATVLDYYTTKADQTA